MNIKRWLLLTYLLLMLLPLGAFYGLYISVNQYYQDKNFSHYFEAWRDILTIKSDITAPALYEENANYETLSAYVNDVTMITLYTPNGRILYSSNPLSSFTAYEANDSLYKNLYELQQNAKYYVYKEPVYQDNVLIGFFKVTKARTQWSEQLLDKTTLVVLLLLIFLTVLYGIMIFFLNRRLNRPLQQLILQMKAFANGQPTTPLPIKKDEIGELTHNFQLMQEQIEASHLQLQEQQRQKEFMIASLSHDLKTPLTSIQAYTESLVANQLTPTEQQEYGQIIQAKSHYMKQLLDDLMMFSLLQSPSYTLQLTAVDGDEFFEMLLSDYTQISKEKGFTTSTYSDVRHTYAVHPKQLMRVMDNLVSNAWTYTNPHGTIRLAAFERETVPSWLDAQAYTKDGCYIVTQNTGSPLSATQCAQLFDPLYQTDEARSQFEQRGAGLGLSIAKQIIEKHHGTIHAESTTQFTTIIIWLPKEN